MVPPDAIVNGIDTWMGVYALTLSALFFSGHLFYHRVIKLIRLGRTDYRFDQPLRRLVNLGLVALGQRKMFQRLSLKDKAVVGHSFIFFGFMSFLVSYILFIFGDSLWPTLSERLITETGVKIFVVYLDLMALIILISLGCAVVRLSLIHI